MALPNTSRSHPRGLQTPTGTIDYDFRAFREASRHRQARLIVTCEAPRHRQGRWIVTWGASRGSLEASGTPTGPTNLDFASCESPQELPRSSKEACGAPEHVKLPSSSLHGPHFEPPDTPTCSELAPSCRILTRFTPQYYSLVGHSGARRFLFLLLNETSVPHAQGPFEPIIATDVTAYYNTRRREVVVPWE